MVWISHCCRQRQRYDPSEDAVSIVVTVMLRAVFTRDKRTGAAVSLFDAVLASLTGCTQRH